VWSDVEGSLGGDDVVEQVGEAELLMKQRAARLTPTRVGATETVSVARRGRLSSAQEVAVGASWSSLWE
jgi:hypothetical protein